jgi:hypothetical protein
MVQDVNLASSRPLQKALLHHAHEMIVCRVPRHGVATT